LTLLSGKQQSNDIRAYSQLWMEVNKIRHIHALYRSSVIRRNPPALTPTFVLLIGGSENYGNHLLEKA